jgi:hypothetical protein
VNIGGFRLAYLAIAVEESISHPSLTVAPSDLTTTARPKLPLGNNCFAGSTCDGKHRRGIGEGREVEQEGGGRGGKEEEGRGRDGREEEGGRWERELEGEMASDIS